MTDNFFLPFPGYLNQLQSLGCCDEAIAWLESKEYPALDLAWSHCPEPDWQMWLLDRAYNGNLQHWPQIIRILVESMSLVPYKIQIVEDIIDVVLLWLRDGGVLGDKESHWRSLMEKALDRAELTAAEEETYSEEEVNVIMAAYNLGISVNWFSNLGVERFSPAAATLIHLRNAWANSKELSDLILRSFPQPPQSFPPVVSYGFTSITQEQT